MTMTRRALVATATASAVFASIAEAISAAPSEVRDPLGGVWDAEGAIERGGGRIHYFERGRGEPLILLPKLGGWAADWRKVAPALAEHRRVIAIDPPGHGGSAMLGPVPYMLTLAESAAMVRAALEELEIERYSIVGSSLGGEIAVTLASLWPSTVQKLVLLSVALTEPQTRAALRSQDAKVRGVNYDAADLPLMRTAGELSRFGSNDPSITEEHNQSRAVAGRWVRASERGVGLAGTANALATITAPTLLIYGDRGVYGDFRKVGESRIKTVKTRIIVDCGSFTQQERPRESAAAINDFLDSTSG